MLLVSRTLASYPPQCLSSLAGVIFKSDSQLLLNFLSSLILQTQRPYDVMADSVYLCIPWCFKVESLIGQAGSVGNLSHGGQMVCQTLQPSTAVGIDKMVKSWSSRPKEFSGLIMLNHAS